MKEFLEYLVTQIVDRPEAVVIDEKIDNLGIINLEITVAPEDMGKVIGKAGRIIKALRDLVRILAVKRNLRVNVVLQEE